MKPQDLLDHADSGTLWNSKAPSTAPGYDLGAAYADALAVRALRIARGEQPRGYKVGFTNRGIWPIYNVFAPIWGCVWDSTLTLCEGEGRVSLAHTCQPRIEPEVVFAFATTPPTGATLQQLFDALDWVAPGFEIVQSHQPDWKFQAPDTVADGGLHAHLLAGARQPVRSVARDAKAFDARLAAARVGLSRNGDMVEEGRGSAVLDGPLQALQHFVRTLAQCPGAPTLQPGDVVTTGTWTNAWPVAQGQTWRAAFEAPLTPLILHLE